MERATILIVEDSPEDFETTVRAFANAGLNNSIAHCVDGDDALDYLFRRGQYAPPNDPPRPAIILLDLNLPGTDGREVLAELKSAPELKRIPIVVLTTSSHERDVQRCYEEGANSYIQKPVNLERFFEAIRRLKDYWLEIAILPRET